MALDERLLGKTRAARERLLDLQHDSELAQVDYHYAIRVLHAAGGSMREIADALDLSHQRVHQIVDAGDPNSASSADADSAGLRWRGRRARERAQQPRRRRREQRDEEREARARRAGSGRETRREAKGEVKGAWLGGGNPRAALVADARRAVELAQDEARALWHNYVGTEHLLLGLLRTEGGLAGRLLASADVDIENVRASVERIIGRSQEPPAEGSLAMTPRAKKVADLAIREAKRDRSEFARGEHLLLALVREGHGVAAQILSDSGFRDYDDLRKQVDRASLHCAFCERNGLEYDRCVAGPGVNICDVCIADASRLVAGGEAVAADIAGRLTLVPGDRPRDCSFCGKPNDRIDHLVDGPHAKICNECLNLCQEILAEQRKDS